jgi:pimeloyl-ACP methyl ester carboxylesterase
MPGFRAFSDELGTTIPNATPVRLADTGHLVPLEAPEKLGRLLQEHLTSTDGP